MAKCPRCSSRKGKRHCPALRTEICSQCCADERLKTIPCPRDCPYLEGEIYQHRRRRERAFSAGKEFVDANARLFTTKGSRDFAFNLQADIYYFSREHGPVPDEVLAGVLEALKSFCSRVFVPPEAPHPILIFLIERLGDAKRYPLESGFTAEERVRALSVLAAHVRSLARSGASSMRHHEKLARFFDALDFEADLDYSPNDARAALAENDGLRRSAGGLILPP